MLNILKYQKAMLFVLVIVFSFVLSFIINYPQLEVTSRVTKVITADNVNEILPTLSDNDFIEVQATVNSLQVLEDENSSYFYSGLEELGSRMIVKADKNKLNSSFQTFTGQVKLLNNSFGETLISKINEPVTLEGGSNLNEKLFEKIKENSSGNFDSQTILLIDGIKPDSDRIYTQTVILGFLFSVLLLLILRDRIFVIH